MLFVGGGGLGFLKGYMMDFCLVLFNNFTAARGLRLLKTNLPGPVYY